MMISVGSIFKGRPQLAVLIDPDHEPDPRFEVLLQELSGGGVDYILLGGSTTAEPNIDRVLRRIKEVCAIPVLLFPGDPMQVSPYADALLLPSLISGRNAEFLIGQHVSAAHIIAKANIPIIPMGYIMVDGGKLSTTAYVTQTVPIPRDQVEHAAQTALAGQHLGMQCIYLEAGSGAELTAPKEMIHMVRDTISIPLIIGGGISTPYDVQSMMSTGADMIVIGTKLEQEPLYLPVLMEAFAAALIP